MSDPRGATGIDELAEQLATGASDTIGVYVHVPYCARRCTYCDFVTYAPGETDRRDPDRYRADAIAEIDLAAGLLTEAGLPTVDTIYFGGGTPTLLPAADLVAIVDHIGRRFPLAPDVEITTEANPDSVDAASLAELRAGGFGRISFGMQSAVPEVLTVLGRSHKPERPVEAVALAEAAGFDHVGLDLIYGSPGETDAHWEASLAAVVASGCDHVSAYGLIVEPRTPLARSVARGELVVGDDDVMARRYRRADQVLGDAGFAWYEVSNWATSPAGRSRHNRRYWANADWWGVGPGAHSHVGGIRWWNHAEPGRWADDCHAGRVAAAGHETVGAEQRRLEHLMLAVRTVDGVVIDDPVAGALDPAAVQTLLADGLATLTPAPHTVDGSRVDPGGRLVLTLQGRLLADTVVRALA